MTMFTLVRPILPSWALALLIFILEDTKRVTKHCLCGGEEDDDLDVFALFASKPFR